MKIDTSPLHKQVVSMSRQGFAPAEIAARLDMLAATVKSHLRRARLSGEPVSSFRLLQIGLSPFEWQLLHDEALKRGTDCYRLAHRLLALVCREQLFNAVLDDEDVELVT